MWLCHYADCQGFRVPYTEGQTIFFHLRAHSATSAGRCRWLGCDFAVPSKEPDALHMHLRFAHTPFRPYPCGGCPKFFHAERLLSLHRAKLHLRLLVSDLNDCFVALLTSRNRQMMFMLRFDRSGPRSLLLHRL